MVSPQQSWINNCGRRLTLEAARAQGESMARVKNGDFVQLHYTGSLEDGTVFDSSVGRQPLEFQVGAGGIIAGFNDAVIGMEVNAENQVTLSPDQAYGELREDLKREFPKEMLGDHPIAVGQELRFTSPHGPVTGTVLAIEPTLSSFALRKMTRRYPAAFSASRSSLRSPRC
jgi:hypothetical protein